MDTDHIFIRRLGIILLAVLGLLCGSSPAWANLYVTDGSTGVVSVYDDSGVLINSGLVTVDDASGLAIGPDGNLYVASQLLPEVYGYNSTTGASTGTFVSYGADPDQNLSIPGGIVFDSAGNLFVADIGASTIHAFNSAGVSTGTFTGPDLIQPVSVALDLSGQLYAVSGGGVQKLSGGQMITVEEAVSGGGDYVLNNPGGLAFSPAGDLFVLDISGASTEILEFNPNGSFNRYITFLNNSFQASNLAMTAGGTLFVSGVDLDTSTGQVLSYDTSGSAATISTVAIDDLGNPTYMATSIPEPSAALLILGGGAMLAATFKFRSRLRF